MYTLSIYVFFQEIKTIFLLSIFWDRGCEFAVQSGNIVGEYISFNNWFQPPYYSSSWEFRFLSVNSIIEKIKEMREERIKMLFGRFYIKNYRANYNSYFPLKLFLYMPLEQLFLMKFVLSQNPITRCKFETDE